MIYEIAIHPAALAEIASLPRKFQRQIDRRIRHLATNPRPENARPLRGRKAHGLWCLRSGDYRIIYQIQEDRLVVLIVRVGHRRDVYRCLPKLPDAPSGG